MDEQAEEKEKRAAVARVPIIWHIYSIMLGLAGDLLVYLMKLMTDDRLKAAQSSDVSDRVEGRRMGNYGAAQWDTQSITV